MKRIITLTESDLKKLILEAIGETNRIRQWTDDDYKRANPYQVSDIDFAAIKKADDDYFEKHNKKVNTAHDLYGKINTGINQNKINDLQKELTGSIQKKYMDKTGKDNPVMSYDEIGKVGGDVLKNTLKKQGLELEVSGKCFSYGNAKLPEDTMIVNITSAWNCPSIKNCAFGKSETCYGMGGEKRYNRTQLRNLRMQHAYQYMSAKELLKLIEAYIESAPVRIKRIRISEEGDFPDQETVDFCDKIAGHLKAKYGIVTVAYTANDLDYSNVKNMIINGSNYKVKGCTRYFRAIPKIHYDKIPDGLVIDSYSVGIPKQMLDTKNGTFKCHCDCRTCDFCYRTKEENGEPEDRTVTVGELFRVQGSH